MKGKQIASNAIYGSTYSVHHKNLLANGCNDISSLRPCAFWWYEAIYSSVLGANNVYFNKMCY